MSEYTSLTSLLQDTADAIKIKLGYASSSKINANEFPTKIAAIPTGGSTPSGTLNIITDGTYNVATYASASVNVLGNLTKVDINETVAALSNASNTYTRTPSIDEYIDDIAITIPSIRTENLTAANIISGTTVKIYSGNTAIYSVSGNAIVPAGTTNITANSSNINVAQYAIASVEVPATVHTAHYAITSSNINTEVDLGTTHLYRYIDVRGYDYTTTNKSTGSLKRRFYSAYGDNTEQYYIQLDPSTNFRITYVSYHRTGGTQNRHGYIDFRNNEIFWYIDAQTQTRSITNTTNGWLDDSVIYTASNQYYTGTVYIPGDGTGQTYIVTVCGYYI